MKSLIKYLLAIIPIAAALALAAYFFWPNILPGASASVAPEQVVEQYYDWYLDYIGDPGTEAFRNPLVDRAYQHSPLLLGSYIGHIDELLDGSEFIPADPFLCAQDIPVTITTQNAFSDEDQAKVIVRTSFQNHVSTVDLLKKWGQWKISNITCGSSPEGLAYSFYTWYLGYLFKDTKGDFNNPLVDRAYHTSGFLSSNLINQVDELIASNDQGGFDPFLLAQDIPGDFSVDPGVNQGTAVVHLQFGESNTKHLLIDTTWEDGNLVIDSIQEDQRTIYQTDQ